MKLETVPCYLCSEPAADPWATENGFHMVKCRGCGLVYLNPRPTLDEIDEAAKTGMHRFTSGALNAISAFSKRKVADYQAKLQQLIPAADLNKPLRWLDIGAGFGELVKAVQQLAATGSYARGIEPCAPKVKKAQALGLPIDAAQLSELNERFTHLSLINVYSHLPDPVAFISDLKCHLEPRGSLVVVTGNGGDVPRAEFPGALYVPDHLSFAGEENVKTVLQRAGFEICAVNRYTDAPSLARLPITFLKNIARRLTGRPSVPLFLPKGSRFRSLWIHARLAA